MPALGELPGGLAAGESAADDVDDLSGRRCASGSARSTCGNDSTSSASSSGATKCASYAARYAACSLRRRVPRDRLRDQIAGTGWFRGRRRAHDEHDRDDNDRHGDAGAYRDGLSEHRPTKQHRDDRVHVRVRRDARRRGHAHEPQVGAEADERAERSTRYAMAASDAGVMAATDS